MGIRENLFRGWNASGSVRGSPMIHIVDESSISSGRAMRGRKFADRETLATHCAQ